MGEDLHQLGKDLITTAARVVRWAPRPRRIRLSFAAARILARINDSGPSRISDLAEQERSSQPTITNHIKRLELAAWWNGRRTRATLGPGVSESPTTAVRSWPRCRMRSAPASSPTWHDCRGVIGRLCTTASRRYDG